MGLITLLSILASSSTGLEGLRRWHHILFSREHFWYKICWLMSHLQIICKNVLESITKKLILESSSSSRILGDLTVLFYRTACTNSTFLWFLGPQAFLVTHTFNTLIPYS